MKKEIDKNRIDPEIDQLWREGLPSKMADRYLAAIQRAGESEAGLGIRARILNGASEPRVLKTRGLRLIPALVPALVLLWMAVSPNPSKVTNPPQKTAQVSTDDAYTEMAALTKDFVADDSIVDQFDSSAWLFFTDK